MLFERRKFGFVFHHAKVVALKIVIADVFHIAVVDGDAKKSQTLFALGIWWFRLHYANKIMQSAECELACFQPDLHGSEVQI